MRLPNTLAVGVNAGHDIFECTPSKNKKNHSTHHTHAHNNVNPGAPTPLTMRSTVKAGELRGTKHGSNKKKRHPRATGHQSSTPRKKRASSVCQRQSGCTLKVADIRTPRSSPRTKNWSYAVKSLRPLAIQAFSPLRALRYSTHFTSVTMIKKYRSYKHKKRNGICIYGHLAIRRKYSNVYCVASNNDRLSASPVVDGQKAKGLPQGYTKNTHNKESRQGIQKTRASKRHVFSRAAPAPAPAAAAASHMTTCR